MNDLISTGKAAKRAAFKLAGALSGEKNKALHAIADALVMHTDQILEANATDMRIAAENGMTDAMQDRLRLDAKRISGIADAVRDIAAQDDPIGKTVGGSVRPNGLKIVQTTVPLGVVGVIFESRPNVTADCAALCLKSGNACILRGGKEAVNSNKAIVEVMRAALESSALNGIESDCIQLVGDTSRETAEQMMKLNEYIDVLIPRGGAGLIQSVVKNATVPVIETGAGNCHIFVDESAVAEMAADIVYNAKVSRPGVCNAVETLLIHTSCADALLPVIAEKLFEVPVELRCCERAGTILGGRAKPATEDDYATEFGDYILAVKVVDSLDEAVAHIERYSTRHSEAIITRDYENSRRFLNAVDSAAVYVNASTRFTDGAEFGFGAEIGISTQKLHARGPMGLSHLTSTKYLISGSGQIR